MRLYHFSEQPGIKVFQPRIAPTSDIQDLAYVWAIEEWHTAMYYLPRDCPRACFWAGPDTTPDDDERWLGGVEARMVIVVESGWLDRIRATTLYRYRMPADPSSCLMRPRATGSAQRQSFQPALTRWATCWKHLSG